LEKEMNGRKPSPLGPALIAGAAGGVLSALPLLSCLCCLWIIGAGVLAAYLLVKRTATLPVARDGALTGAWAGAAAATVVSILSVPLAPMNIAFARRFMDRLADYVPKMPSGWEQWLQPGGGSFSIPWFLGGWLLNAVIFAAFAALGGIIGINLFAAHPAGPSAPSPPPTSGSPS
jgi:hypothetical protein